MSRNLCLWVLLITLFLSALGRSADGFWATGHHVIAVLAFELLEPAERNELLTILKSHPRFEKDFSTSIPASIRGDTAAIQRWQIGVAGEWSDIIRPVPEWNRSSWHYQLGASLTLGDVDVPAPSFELPSEADLETQELHIAQAVELCKQTLSDPARSDSDRALAICWLAHLVADAHQPCHAGSLYSERAFPKGDLGANRIEVTNGKNLHAVWDSLLGSDLAAGDVRRRVARLRADSALVVAGLHAADEAHELSPDRWIAESRTLARQYVYTTDVLKPVYAIERGLTDEFEPITLSEDYLEKAGRVAQVRASEAGYRLAAIWREALAKEKSTASQSE